MTKLRTRKLAAKPAVQEPIPQIERFKAMAQELGADESPGALDRAFGWIDAKRIETKKPAKRRAKEE